MQADPHLKHKIIKLHDKTHLPPSTPILISVVIFPYVQIKLSVAMCRPKGGVNIFQTTRICEPHTIKHTHTAHRTRIRILLGGSMFSRAALTHIFVCVRSSYDGVFGIVSYSSVFYEWSNRCCVASRSMRGAIIQIQHKWRWYSGMRSNTTTLPLCGDEKL